MNSYMLTLYSARARLEATNIARRSSMVVGMTPMSLHPGCPLRCGALVGASVLPYAKLTGEHASAYASALTCLERALVLHTQGSADVLIGDALLARVFRHMGRLPTCAMDNISRASEDLISEAKDHPDPTFEAMENSDASRLAWQVALAACGIPSDSDYTKYIVMQRPPPLYAVDEIYGGDSYWRGTIEELLYVSE